MLQEEVSTSQESDLMHPGSDERSDRPGLVHADRAGNAGGRVLWLWSAAATQFPLLAGTRSADLGQRQHAAKNLAGCCGPHLMTPSRHRVVVFRGPDAPPEIRLGSALRRAVAQAP